MRGKEVVPRKRSASSDLELMKVELLNKKELFGKAMLDASDCTNKKKVGPLKIIRLPSDRSIPETVPLNQNSIVYSKSLRGSIRTPLDLELGSPKYHQSKEYKIFTAKHSLNNNLRISPALTPKGFREFGIRSNKNSRKVFSKSLLNLS